VILAIFVSVPVLRRRNGASAPEAESIPETISS
jgi:hypothetical protein